MESTSVRAARIRSCASCDSARGAPSATSLNCRQDRGRSRRMRGGMGPLGLDARRLRARRRMRAPGLEIIAIALEQHTHIARAANGARLAQRYAYPGEAEVFEEQHGNVLGEGFDQMKLGCFDKGQHALRDPLVVERVF